MYRDDLQRKKQHKEYELWSSQKIDYIVPRYPKKKLSASAVKWLKRNKIAQKYINTKAVEYYHNGQLKQVVIFVGDYDDIDMMTLDWIDYDEQGKMQVFKTKDARFSWTLGKDMDYRMKMDEEELHECRGVIFPEKKPSKKTGQTYKSGRTKKIIIKLKRYWDDNLPLTHLYAKDWFKKIAKDEDITPQAVKKIERQYRPKDFTPKR